MDAKTQEMLKRVRMLEIQTRKIVNQALTGSYQSAFKGRGIDFEEVREYAYGDDVRSIDWNVTARSDWPYVKQFREERELSIILMLDLSASGFFGSSSQSKRDLAIELASVLAFSASLSNDKVGLVLFTDRIEKLIIPAKGRKHVLRIIRELLVFESEGKSTDIIGALGYVLKMMKKRSVIFLLSDFLQFSDAYPQTDSRQPLFKTLRLAEQKHDLICGIISDPREEELPSVGIIELEDAETGDIVEVNTQSRRLRERYAHVNREFKKRRDIAFKKSGLDYLHLRTNESYVKALQGLFERRANA